jgi:hypothetical protein
MSQDRSRQTLADYNRSALRTEPPGFSAQSRRLDAIAAADERARQQAKQVELMNAELIAHAKGGELSPARETYTRRSAEDIHD